MTFKKRRKFLTSKQLVCLLKFFWTSVDSSAIIVNQKIAQKLIEKTSMTDIDHHLTISTSTVIRKLNDFYFKYNFSRLPEIMFWDVETVRGVTVSIGR